MKTLQEKFQIKNLAIETIGNWIISLRPNQVTLGSLIVSLNRPCVSLAHLTTEESLQLNTVFQVVDKMLKSTLSPDKINYLALMMIDAQVHFHVIPRYEKPVNFRNVEYGDYEWPKPPNVLDSLELSKVEVQNLWVYMKENI